MSLWDNGQIIPLATALNIGVIGIGPMLPALSQQVDRPIPPGTLLAHDVASAQTLDFLLNGPMRTLSQAAMVFCLMNKDIATIVPGVKNVAEIEELAACVALPPFRQRISPACGNSMPGASAATARPGEPVRGGAHGPWTGGRSWSPLFPRAWGKHGSRAGAGMVHVAARR